MSRRNYLIVQEDQDFQLNTEILKQGGFNEWKDSGSFVLLGFFEREYKQ